MLLSYRDLAVRRNTTKATGVGTEPKFSGGMQGRDSPIGGRSRRAGSPRL